MSDAAAARPKAAQIWERDPHDWYVEPVAASAAMFRVERFVGSIWDPAAGGGNIIEAAVAAGYEARGTDVIKRRNLYRLQGGVDFMSFGGQPLAQNIVTNPPFFGGKGAEAFIRKALQLAKGKVAAFVDIRFIAGGKRAQGLYRENPPHRIYIVTPRVSCPPGAYLDAGNKAGNGSSDWCWLIWDNASPFVSTTMLWLDVSKERATPEVAA